MNIHTVFAHRPTFRTVVQLKRPLDITAPTSQLVNLRHVGVGLAPPAVPGLPGGNVVVAAAALPGHTAVVLDGNGNALPADPFNALHGAAVVGITRGAALADDPVSLASLGSLEHLGWTFTPGQPVYLGAAGQLTQSPPQGQFIKVLGMAVTATRITVSIQPAIYFN